MIIHLNGMPGVGKFTVARLLAEKLNARLIDNHLLIDLATTICENRGAEYILIIKKLMDVVLEQIAENPNKLFIFTNALSAEFAEDRERFEQISRFASENNIPFVQVLLTSDLEENKQRIVSEDRKTKGKLTDADELEKLHQNYTIYHPPTECSLTIDTTRLSPENVSEQIKNYVKNLTTAKKD